MLRRDDRWLWDSWPVDDGDTHHLFYLQAPRSLGDPDARHHAATIGHAVTADYERWDVLPDALWPARAAAWDDLAVWTGSVVRGEHGGWHLFYSAISRRDQGRVQRIGRADSDDLIHWRRYGDRPVVRADPRWYETLNLTVWREEAWRDPWVFRDPDGDGWHMLITARVGVGPRFGRGVLGHAWSPDLDRWEVRPPLTTPAGFAHLEVPQVATLNGRPILIFCCAAADLSAERRVATPRAGTWSVPGDSLLGPFDLDRAEPFADPSRYAAHLVGLNTGRPALLGFDQPANGAFTGVIPPPQPVRLNAAGLLIPG